MLDYRTRLGMPAAPAASATVTLFNNFTNDGPTPGLLDGQERIVFAIQASADSGASGVVVESSSDGTTWSACADGSGGSYPKTYTSTGKTLYDVPIQGQYMRIKYTNSNATLSTWGTEAWLEPQRAGLA